MAQANRHRAHKEAVGRPRSGLKLQASGDREVKNAIMIRQTKPPAINRLPDRSDSPKHYEYGMLQSAKALLQAILESGRVHGPMTDEQQIDAIAWAYDVKVTVA